MDTAGVNSDQNFFARPPHFPDDDERTQFYDNLTQPPGYERPPQLPPKDPIVTSNLYATALNGYVAGSPATPGDSPDDFYRAYRDVQSAQGYSDINMTNGSAPTIAGPRQTSSSFRSNSNGTTPKHPTITSTRNGPKPYYRSPSVPLENGMPLNNAKSAPVLNGNPRLRQPSVKDLLKRFDQQNAVEIAPNSTLQKPRMRLDNGINGPGYSRSRTPSDTRSSAVAHRPGQMTRDANGSPVGQSATRGTQRSKFVAEDHQSINTLSSAARRPRKRPEISGNASASQSMTDLLPTASSFGEEVVRRPLFGEVVPDPSGQSAVGYGISQVRDRRTSESSLQPPSMYQRDISPSSPTAWYLGVAPSLDAVNTMRSPNLSPKHNRAQSDLAGGNSNVLNRTSSSLQDIHNTQSTSRLPVYSNRLPKPSSPPSTRSDSPLTSRVATSNGSKGGKLDGRGTSTDAISPQKRVPRRQSAGTGQSSISNASLKAYISAPLPKTSPPLRSSRPRQPVSNATTTSSKGKAVDRSSSPQPSFIKNARRAIRDARGGPVDYAARRAKIKQAYSQIIEDSELSKLAETEPLGKPYKVMNEVDLNEDVDSTMSTKSQTASTSEPTLMIDTSFLTPSNVDSSMSYNRASNGVDLLTLSIPGSFPGTEEGYDVASYPPSATSDLTEIDNEAQVEVLERDSRLHYQMPQMVDAHSQRRQESADSSINTSTDNESVQIMLDTGSMGSDEISTSNEVNDAQKLPDLRVEGEEGYLRARVYRPSSAPEASDDVRLSPLTENGRQGRGGALQLGLHQDGYLTNDGVYDEQYEDDIQHTVDESSQNCPPPWKRQTEYDMPAKHIPLIDTGLKVPFPISRGLRSENLETPVTDIDYDSSDGLPETVDGHDMLNAPFKTQRTSQQSTWTDYTVNSNDGSSWREVMEDTHIDDEVPDPPPKERPQVPPKPLSYSPQPVQSASEYSALSSLGQPFERTHSVTRESRDTGVVSNVNSITPPIPALPNYSPPPPPQQFDLPPATSRRSPPPASFYNRRPVSSNYRLSHRDPESGRVSAEDVSSSRPSMSTRRSSAQISFESDNTVGNFSVDEPMKDELQETKKLEEVDLKAKARLRQRQMTIKELIDTESVYLKDMNVVEEIYKGTAEACPKLEATDIQTIFRNSGEIIAFSTTFLHDLKIASVAVYSPRSKARQNRLAASSLANGVEEENTTSPPEETDWAKDQKTFVGATFAAHLENMQIVYTDFLKTSEQATGRLMALQSDGAVKVWLGECNTVAKDLTAAWDLDALLVKPVQRITRYQLLLAQILEKTPEDHPDYAALRSSREGISNLLTGIDDLKKRIDTVSKIVGRKRKESDVRPARTALAKAFARRDKTPSSANRPPEDEVYQKHMERFHEDFMNVQVIMRDVEFYTRQVSNFVRDFLKYLSAMELYVTYDGSSPYPELVSKWRRFNMSMRDIGSIALEDHLAVIRKQVIEPMEQICKAHTPPEMAIKKRNKRRLDYEKWLSLKNQNKKIDDKLAEQVVQYEALNETLKFELPKLEYLTSKVVNFCLERYIAALTKWYAIWQQKVKTVLEESQMPKDFEDIVDKFQRDFKFPVSQAEDLGILNGSFLDNGAKGRLSQAATLKDDGSSITSKSRPPPLDYRFRGYSAVDDRSPSIPTPDFVRRQSGQFLFSPNSFSPMGADHPGFLQFNAGDSPLQAGQALAESSSETPDTSSSRPPRPSTGRSVESSSIPRKSMDSAEALRSPLGSAYYFSSPQPDGPPLSSRPFSGFFNSALPEPEDEEESRRSSRASSRDRGRSVGYNVLYLAASLFEFNISATKTEAGYPYLTYAAGEIFDVIGEKGELWLAKNQDDPSDQVGWIWSKHFARLATD